MNIKPWTQSLTIWGVVAMAIPAVAKLFGLTISGDDAGVITDQAAAIWQSVAALVAVYGRVRATAPIATPARLKADEKPKAKARNAKGRFQ